MKRYLLIVPMALSLAACETQDQTTLASTAAGAAIGAAVTNHNPVQGAAIGGIVGLGAATLLRPANTPGQCVYRDYYGRRYIAAC